MATILDKKDAVRFINAMNEAKPDPLIKQRAERGRKILQKIKRK